jgi:predicted nuclease of predicted toxin-antitoxin system
MKILLDECVTKRLKNHLQEFEIFTVRQLGLSGIKNGQLMAYCVENNFDILLTIDKNLIFQQNLDKYSVTIVVLNSLTSKIEELITFLPAFKLQIKDFKKHQAYLIEKNQEQQ